MKYALLKREHVRPIRTTSYPGHVFNFTFGYTWIKMGCLKKNPSIF